ncbi:MAG: UDP-N-acetylglucosamine 2-epimerase (non-hydrolyzing) [Lachnospiraceae bacterium]|nr:UDP-N-acetylglucosamine 2-epimerase (non-hydrolyzing) [Lachnospiraceae bacterium]
MNEIVHIVGNRPQFIKLAPLYHELERRNYEQCIIHSGQHYDAGLSDIFFKELSIPQPYINLKVGSGTHAEITAGVMLGLEKELINISPRFVVLYGDTDTTLAGALTAAKLNIPIAHVEGGIRTHYKGNPEEYNRIVADHLSDILFCPDKVSLDSAEKEGMIAKAYLTGDIMYDTFLSMDSGVETTEDEIILMTWHRQENTDRKDRMESIIRFIRKLDGKIICPMHPRTQKCLKNFGLWEEVCSIENLKIIDPVGYLEMISLMKRARLIVTDSGGVSKESSFAGAKCLFMLEADIWDDLVKHHWILKMNPEDEASVKEALLFSTRAARVAESERPKFYGDGQAAVKMVDLLESKLII